jgi:hypothetical protein
VLLSSPVVAIDPHKHVVVTAHAAEIQFGQALIATGASAVRTRAPGANPPGIYHMRTLADAESIRSAAELGKRAVVLGAASSASRSRQHSPKWASPLPCSTSSELEGSKGPQFSNEVPAMSQAATLLVAALVLLGAASALVFLAYRDELMIARAWVSHGAWIVSTTSGPIEYAEKSAGIPLLSIHGRRRLRSGPCQRCRSRRRRLSRHIAPSRFGYLGTPCLPTHRAPPKPMRMQRFSPN